MRYIPMLCIFALLASAILTAPIRSGRRAFGATLTVVLCTAAASALLLGWLVAGNPTGEPMAVTFAMGKFAAPFGNELKLGPLQALLTTVFSFVVGLAMLGGYDDFLFDVEREKRGLYCTLLSLTLAALYVLTYTNDLFTGYVFIEISTMTACALVMVRERGETIVATLRYLFLSLLGSGLFLIGIAMLYSTTGHLLMEPMAARIAALLSLGEYRLPLTVAAGVMMTGLGVKSALFPFHRWLKEAHGTTTTTSSAVLSGVVIKGTVVLQITVFCRVFTLEGVHLLHLDMVMLILGLCGMVAGSVEALHQHHAKRMLACSSVAQMGYVFMGIGLASRAGLAAACFHIIVHALSKSLLFCSVGRLSAVSRHKKDFTLLRGSALRDPLAGIAFTVGAMSVIGIPLFAGFTSKLNFATASVASPKALAFTLVVIMLSTVLSAMYYLPAVTAVWSHSDEEFPPMPRDPYFNFCAVISVALILLLGMAYTPVMEIIELGIDLL
ncbi:MAG: sodium:proton antiporter [Oscillospiraceae bacterium]|nr:sodium:proton antiporter [Oscillospiraceae bacterium]